MNQALAERLRPKNLQEYLGQADLVGKPAFIWSGSGFDTQLKKSTLSDTLLLLRILNCFYWYKHFSSTRN